MFVYVCNKGDGEGGKKKTKNVPIAARPTKPTADNQTFRKAVAYVSFSAPAPAPTICELAPGTRARAVSFCDVTAVIKSATEVSGRPAPTAASAMLVPRLPRADEKTAVSFG